MSSAPFHVQPTALPGCVELRPRRLDDERGRFLKVFARSAFAALGLATDFPESYYSVSRRGVIRGLHFQIPPSAHAKLVYCTAGTVQDAAVDLRIGSPTYGQHVVLELSAETGNLLYLPAGLAHGFCVLSESATMVYHVGSEYAPEHDAGILWNSVGIPWACATPQLSPRDQAHPRFVDFVSPFRHAPEGAAS